MDEFFVMLTCQSGMMTPLLNETGELAVYPSFMGAADDANRNPLGRYFGYEVFKRGEGVHQG